MKKKLTLLGILITGSAYTQVGIGTSNPEATLDIRGKNHLGSVTSQDGLLVPRVNNLSTAGSVNGQLVYLIENSGSFLKGFHYWNNTIWTPFTGSASSGDPSIDAWIDNPSNKRVELGTKSDGSQRTTGTEFVAQDNGNVGIGTSVPNDTAILDLNSSNKGLKLPYVNLQSLKDIATIANPVDGLMVYNPGTSTSLQNGIYVFDGPTQSWSHLQKYSETTGSSISKTTYIGAANAEKVLTVGKYRFRVNNSNVIQMSHSQSTSPLIRLSIVDNVFKSVNTFWYSAPKWITLPAGNTTWVGTAGGTSGAISANPSSGSVTTLYFTDHTDSKFYRIVIFRSNTVPAIYTMLGEIF